jgi:AraC family transcriptional regulator
MNPVEKALWFVENRLAGEVSLQAIARSVGVSNHHLARAFGAATGQSLMRYARGRRLSEAARSLVTGAPDILMVALDAGYGSHEAFTRAFREQFGMTPEHCRSLGNLDHIQLVEPIRMDKSLLIDLDEPRFEELGELLIAGFAARYTFDTNQGIPAQWQRFGPHIGAVPAQFGPETYGVACNFDNGGSFEYVAGVRVSDFGELPDGFATIRIPARRYAVFRHPAHVSMLRRTHYTIWNQWLPSSGVEIADAPNFERYGKEFNPMTGSGPIEVWMPVNHRATGA